MEEPTIPITVMPRPATQIPAEVAQSLLIRIDLHRQQRYATVNAGLTLGGWHHYLVATNSILSTDEEDRKAFEEYDDPTGMGVHARDDTAFGDVRGRICPIISVGMNYALVKAPQGAPRDVPDVLRLQVHEYEESSQGMDVSIIGPGGDLKLGSLIKQRKWTMEPGWRDAVKIFDVAFGAPITKAENGTLVYCKRGREVLGQIVLPMDMEEALFEVIVMPLEFIQEDLAYRIECLRREQNWP